MLFRIEPESDVPIYDQIEAQIIFGIASGSLAVGELIPSVRDMAGRVGVHPNTVARAYRQLEDAGAVEVRRGRGMEVVAESVEVCRRLRRKILGERLRHALGEVMSSGLPVAEVRRLVEEELSRLQARNNGSDK